MTVKEFGEFKTYIARNIGNFMVGELLDIDGEYDGRGGGVIVFKTALRGRGYWGTDDILKNVSFADVQRCILSYDNRLSVLRDDEYSVGSVVEGYSIIVGIWSGDYTIKVGVYCVCSEVGVADR